MWSTVDLMGLFDQLHAYKLQLTNEILNTILAANKKSPKLITRRCITLSKTLNFMTFIMLIGEKVIHDDCRLNAWYWCVSSPSRQNSTIDKRKNVMKSYKR
jgi:hypothetical protein